MYGNGAIIGTMLTTIGIALRITQPAQLSPGVSVWCAAATMSSELFTAAPHIAAASLQPTIPSTTASG